MISRDGLGILSEHRAQFEKLFSPDVLAYHQNIFGGTLGGPLFIPKLFNKDRNKVFFFLSEQGVKQSEGSTQTGITPTADQRGRFVQRPDCRPHNRQPVSEKFGGPVCDSELAVKSKLADAAQRDSQSPQLQLRRKQLHQHQSADDRPVGFARQG